MRLWTLHPQYLDTKGLTAVWREALLAQAVLRGENNASGQCEYKGGYRNHPQLKRFRATQYPLHTIAAYLMGIKTEATHRGYHFDSSKIGPIPDDGVIITATTGQLYYEWQHLLAKLQVRAEGLYATTHNIDNPIAHPLFTIIQGPVAEWEVRR